MKDWCITYYQYLKCGLSDPDVNLGYTPLRKHAGGLIRPNEVEETLPGLPGCSASPTPHNFQGAYSPRHGYRAPLPGMVPHSASPKQRARPASLLQSSSGMTGDEEASICANQRLRPQAGSSS